MRVFVNECPVTVTPGATAADAIAVVDSDMPGAIERGSVYVTDGTGAIVAPSTPLAAGSILRVVRSSPSEPTPRSDS